MHSIYYQLDNNIYKYLFFVSYNNQLHVFSN